MRRNAQRVPEPHHTDKPPSLAFGVLFHNAWARTKDRWVDYTKTVVILWAGFVGLLTPLVPLIAITLGMRYDGISKPETILYIGLTAAIFIYAFVAGFVYISFMQLALTNVIINPARLSFRENVRFVKRVLRKKIIFEVCITLLTLVFLPADFALRAIIGMAIISWLLNFWNVFSGFIVLEKNEQGFDIYWASQTIVNKQFLHNLLRLAVIYLMLFGSILAGLLFIFFLGFIIKAMVPLWAYTIYLIVALSATFFLFISMGGTFAQSFSYELYRALPYPQPVKRPDRTIFLLIILASWIFAALIYTMYPKNYTKIFKDYYRSERKTHNKNGHKNDRFRKYLRTSPQPSYRMDRDNDDD